RPPRGPPPPPPRGPGGAGPVPAGPAGSGGPLARAVHDYAETMRRLVPTVRDPGDWAPLAGFVAVDDFERVGTFLEVQDWGQYLAMLTAWASATDAFETVVRRVTEVDRLVFYEIVERHHRG